MALDDLDKRAMGRRIRQIRVAAGLKQWELASRLGTTQSAVHKYERGVVPEPRRLVEIARIGATTIEWILTGRHWEDGSEARERLPAEILELARRVHAMGQEERQAVEEALRVVRDAVRGLAATDAGTPVADVDPRVVHSAVTLRLLEAAWRIQCALLGRVAEDSASRLESTGDEAPNPSERTPG